MPQTKTAKRKRLLARWKRAEDWWWKVTGWKRFGHIRRGKSCADLVNEVFSLDVTTIDKMPARVRKEMEDAEYHAALSTRTPIVAMHEAGEDMMNGIVFMRAKEFINLHVGNRENV